MNKMFWQEVGLARRNPRLYKTWKDWVHYLEVTPFYELAHGLKGYFGASDEQVRAWEDFAQSRDAKDDEIVIQAKLAFAQKATWENGRLPSRFEWLLDEGWEDPDARCSICGEHHS
jgi:hypothetical protein